MLDQIIAFIVGNKNFICFYVVAHLIPYFVCVHILGKGHLKRHKDPQILEKFEPFNRIDVDHWVFIKRLPAIFLFWPRGFMVLAALFAHLCWIWFWMFVLSDDSHQELRNSIIHYHAWICCRVHMFSCGIVWLKHEK